MTHDDETYDERRIEALRGMLRELAQRILDLDREERLLQNVPELLRRMGDLRSELFHYKVRATYDTPEVEAQTAPDFLAPELPDPEDDEPWRRPRPE